MIMLVGTLCLLGMFCFLILGYVIYTVNKLATRYIGNIACSVYVGMRLREMRGDLTIGD